MLRVAEQRPQTRAELEQLPGIGAQRSAHYGDAILDLVKMYPEKPGDAERMVQQRTEQAQQKTLQAQSAAPEQSEPPSPQLERQVFLRLQEIRQKMAIATGSKQFEIASNALLRAIAERAPGSVEELALVPGFADSRLAKETTQIVTYIWALRRQSP